MPAMKIYPITSSYQGSRYVNRSDFTHVLTASDGWISWFYLRGASYELLSPFVCTPHLACRESVTVPVDIPEIMSTRIAVLRVLIS